MPVGDFILTKGQTGTMWQLPRASHVCMYSIHYSMFDSVWSSYHFPCPSYCPMRNFVPVLFLLSRASGAYFALQVPLFRCHCPSYIPHSQGAAIVVWAFIQHDHQLKLGALDRQLIDWMSCLVPDDWEWSGRLAPETRLILDCAGKLIISVFLSSL